MEALLPLALLACPIGMGLMMFFMWKGMGGGKRREDETVGRSLSDLKADHARLAEEIEALERKPARKAPERA